MEIHNAAVTDSTWTSDEYGIANKDAQINLVSETKQNRSVEKSKTMGHLDRLFYFVGAAIVYAPLVVAGVAFQNYLIYLVPAIPFLAAAFIYLMLIGTSGKTSLKA